MPFFIFASLLYIRILLKIKKYFQSQLLLYHDNISDTFLCYNNSEKRFKKYNRIDYNNPFTHKFKNNLTCIPIDISENLS